jgi:signal transduction histidine kinase
MGKSQKQQKRVAPAGPESGPAASTEGANESLWEDLDAFVGDLVQRLAAGAGGETGSPPPQDLAREVRRRLARLHEALRVRDYRLAELQSQQDEFLSVVAHDLRTPLVAIQGFAQLLLAGGSLGERQQTYVERILQGVRAMSRLVEDLRTARRLDRGVLSLQCALLDPEGFTADLLEMHREEARQKEVQLQIEVAESPPRLRCDPERLGQALGNLLQNAIKFSPRGSRIVLGLRPTPTHLRFEVVDQGPGIDESLMPRLFERFTQGAPAGEASGKGFGLGLHICREIVVLHGGRVGARNLPLGGSCFWVEVPLGGPKGGAQPAVSSEGEAP